MMMISGVLEPRLGQGCPKIDLRMKDLTRLVRRMLKRRIERHEAEIVMCVTMTGEQTRKDRYTGSGAS